MYVQLIYDICLFSELSIVGRDGADGASSGLLHYKGGTVCDHGFDLNSAYAICSVLGFPENSTQWFSGNQWSIQSTYSITLGDVICRTSSWSSCTYSESPNCDHNEDVFLTCADEGKKSISTKLPCCFCHIRPHEQIQIIEKVSPQKSFIIFSSSSVAGLSQNMYCLIMADHDARVPTLIFN